VITSPKKTEFSVILGGLFNASFLAAWRAVVFLLTYWAPRELLHLAQAGTRLAEESSPPASCSKRWSACVAGRPHPQ
jgi:hypothetical protein